MRLLIDSHALLWLASEPERLTRKAAQAVRSRDNDLVLSAASIWELTGKTRLGKLRLAPNAKQFLEQVIDMFQMEILPISRDHAFAQAELPGAHRDPFDRILAAQGITEGIPIVTGDPAFEILGARTIW